MKRQRDRFPWPLSGEEFDVAEYFIKLEKHKSRFLILIFLAVAVSFVHFKYFETPEAESQLSLDIGFPSIKQGIYPDGSIFEKNDIVAGAVLDAVYKNIPELADGKRWHRANFDNFFLVEGVYPMDIMLAKKQLASGAGKPEEIVAHYAKVDKFTPTQFIVSFQPMPLMPESLKSKVFEELVRQYRKQVLDNHFPALQAREEVFNENASITSNYDRLNKRVQWLNGLVARFSGGINDRADFHGNSGERSGERTDVSRWQGASELTPALAELNTEINILDTMILDEKLAPDFETYRRQIEGEISNINFEIKRIEKQADFRLRLAALTKGTASESQAGAQSEAGAVDGSKQIQDTRLFDMLLSYGPQYYAMIDDTRTMFDKKVELEQRRDIMQYRLSRLNVPARANVVKSASQEELVEKLKRTFASLSLQEKNFVEAYFKGMAEHESPVSRYVIVHQAYSFPAKKMAFWAAILAVMLCGGQALIIYLRQIVAGKIEEKLMPVNVTSAKMTGKS